MRSTTGAAASLMAVWLVATAAGSASAETGSVVTERQIQDAIEARLQRQDQSREAILSLLQRPEVARMAEGLGLDLRRATNAVATLEGAELEKLGAQAAGVERDLSGGSSNTITMSVTTLLLIIIIVILLV